MKKIAFFVCFLLIIVSLYSCSLPSSFYGAWYHDAQGIRNAIHFSENAEGKDVFAWAVRDIENDTMMSNTRGYYRISGDQIIFDAGDGTAPYSLNYSFEDGYLILSSDTAIMKLQKFELESDD